VGLAQQQAGVVVVGCNESIEAAVDESLQRGGGASITVIL
jgi:hypothetical protein